MKKLYTLVAAFFLTLSAFAAPVLTANFNGAWRTGLTWTLNRAPQNGDTVVIPSNRIVVVDNNWGLNGKLFIKVYGTLRFSGGGSKLTMNAGSTVIAFAGGLIDGGGSPSQILNIGGVTVYQGNQPDIAGPMFANGILAAFAPYNPLPVKFLGFNLTRKNNDVLVQWSTSEELNADRYELERSFDGNTWNTVALIAAAGTTNSVQNYSHLDRNSGARTAYYRIRQIDLDGRFTYTPVKAVRNGTSAADVQIAAVSGKVVLQFPNEVQGQVSLRFVNLNGQVVGTQNLTNPVGQVVINTAFSGNLVVALSNGAGFNAARQVRL